MIRHCSRILICVLIVVLAACAPAAQQDSRGAISPGDKVGEFLISTGVPNDFTYDWSLDCTGPDEAATCSATVGTRVNVSWGVFAPQGKDLDTIWAAHTYNMFINDTPVNLEGFGSIDTFHPIRGKMRHWNVVIAASKPGELSVRSAGVVDGEPFQGITTYVFRNP